MISVCFSYRNADLYRERNYMHTRKLYEEFLQDQSEPFEVVRADSMQSFGFNRGHALNNAVFNYASRDSDMYIFADIDMVPNKNALLQGLEVAKTAISFVVPFTRILFMTKAATDRYFAERKYPEVGSSDIEFDFKQHGTGSINILRRDVWETVGPFDENLTSWGYEDAAFDRTANILLGPTTWIEGTIVHLWHPRAEDRGTKEQQECLRYCQQNYDNVHTKEQLEETLKKRPRPLTWNSNQDYNYTRRG